MCYKYVPKTVLLKLEEKTEKYKTAKEMLAQEIQRQAEPPQLQFAASVANTAYLEFKHAQQLVNNYLGKNSYAS